MILNYKDKVAKREQELFDKYQQAKFDMQLVKQKEERAATLLFKKAMRRTRSKSPIRLASHTDMRQ